MKYTIHVQEYFDSIRVLFGDRYLIILYRVPLIITKYGGRGEGRGSLKCPFTNM